MNKPETIEEVIKEEETYIAQNERIMRTEAIVILTLAVAVISFFAGYLINSRHPPSIELHSN